jgi:type VI secretion system secreted protein Hcp
MENFDGSVHANERHRGRIDRQAARQVDYDRVDELGHPSVTDGARDMERVRGRTTCADVVIVRQLDKSTTKLEKACANGTFYEQVEIHFCTTVQDKNEPYLKCTLHDVIVTSYSFHGNAESQPRPSESVTLGYTKVEWEYVQIDPKTGKKQGSVPASYDPGKASKS